MTPGMAIATGRFTIIVQKVIANRAEERVTVSQAVRKATALPLLHHIRLHPLLVEVAAVVVVLVEDFKFQIFYSS